MLKKVWLSLCSDRIFKTESQAFSSGEDFVEGYYCDKCKCTTTTDCECNEHIKHIPILH